MRHLCRVAGKRRRDGGGRSEIGFGRQVDEQNASRAANRARAMAAAADIVGEEHAPAAAAMPLAAEDVSKAFGDHILVRNFSIRVMRGDRVGIVGPNGAGKTTLLKLLTGALAPDRGSIRLGTNLTAITLDQRRESLDPEWTLAQAMTGGGGDTVAVGDETRHVIGYMKDFLFRPEQARTPVSVLSGGERARLTLARAFARPCNLLVLDEPTNDLDLETLDLLQEKLAEFGGTVLLVSHDRDFLDRVVTSSVASEGNGSWVEYAGGYTDMLAQRAAAQPAVSGAKSGPVKRPRPAARGGGSVATPPRRMNFKDQRELALLPARIATLQTQITELTAILADPNLYARDRARFNATAQALAVARDGLSAAEEQWLRLELLREEFEAAEPRH